MNTQTIAAGCLSIILLSSSPSHAGEDRDADMQAMAARVVHLEARVKQLEDLVLPVRQELSAQNRATSLREKFKVRIDQDRTRYNGQELSEIESLYQVANKQWDSPESQASLKKLIDTYPDANRTGCALLYLGQMASGTAREHYLKQAIADFSDCFYGDGVQVGAYARFFLAHDYRNAGKQGEASALFNELQKQYPDAVDHKGRLLVDLIPK